jgi:hypothetical protein
MSSICAPHKQMWYSGFVGEVHDLAAPRKCPQRRMCNVAQANRPCGLSFQIPWSDYTMEAPRG